MVTVRAKSKRFLKEEWDTLMWIIAAFTVLYVTEFASNVLFNPLANRSWQCVSLVSFIINIICIVILARRSPRLEFTEWDSTPTPTIGFITGCTGIISFMISMWPVWRYWIFVIVPILFMGIISAISLF